MVLLSLEARIPKGGKCMCKQQTAFRQSCYDAIVENQANYKKQRVYENNEILKSNICPKVFEHVQKLSGVDA